MMVFTYLWTVFVSNKPWYFGFVFLKKKYRKITLKWLKIIVFTLSCLIGEGNREEEGIKFLFLKNFTTNLTFLGSTFLSVWPKK